MSRQGGAPSPTVVLVTERVVGFILAIAVTTTLSRESLQYFTFWYGHAHILLAWLYRASSPAGGGRIRTALTFVLLNAGLFSLYYSASVPWFGPLALLTNLFFLYHLVTDEVYLFRLPLNLKESPLHLGRFLEALLLFLLVAAPMVDGLPYYGPQFWQRVGLEPLSWSRLSLLLAALLVPLYATVVARGLHRPDGGSAYLLGFGAAVASVNAVYGPISHFRWFAFLVVLHVTHWYIHYFFGVSSETARRRQYLLRVALSNLFFLVLLLGALFDPGDWLGTLGSAVYDIENYYLWTVAHLMVSTRMRDLSTFLRRPGPEGAPGC
jgi:hypothetical protein